jgi:hypothetical protein
VDKTFSCDKPRMRRIVVWKTLDAGKGDDGRAQSERRTWGTWGEGGSGIWDYALYGLVDIIDATEVVRTNGHDKNGSPAVRRSRFLRVTPTFQPRLIAGLTVL